MASENLHPTKIPGSHLQLGGLVLDGLPMLMEKE
jgi:hypothetical protein